MWTNYFKLQVSNDLKLYQYAIQIDSKPKGKEPKGKKRQQTLKLAQEEMGNWHTNHPNGTVWDGDSILYSFEAIPQDSLTATITYKGELEDNPPERNQEHYTVSLQPTVNSPIRLAELLRYLNSTAALETCLTAPLILTAVNMVISNFGKHHPKKTVLGGKRFFMNNTSENVRTKKSYFSDLPGGLKASRGFFSSVRPAAGGLLLNVNVTTGAFYEEVPLKDLMKAFETQYDQDRSRDQSQETKKRHLQAFLKGLRIQLHHLPKRWTGKTKQQEPQLIPRCRTIFGLAAPSDGKKLTRPQKIDDGLGSGPEKTRFWKVNSRPVDREEDMTKGDGKYVSVAAYFADGKASPEEDAIIADNVNSVQRLAAQ